MLPRLRRLRTNNDNSDSVPNPQAYYWPDWQENFQLHLAMRKSLQERNHITVWKWNECSKDSKGNQRLESQSVHLWQLSTTVGREQNEIDKSYSHLIFESSAVFLNPDYFEKIYTWFDWTWFNTVYYSLKGLIEKRFFEVWTEAGNILSSDSVPQQTINAGIYKSPWVRYERTASK